MGNRARKYRQEVDELESEFDIVLPTLSSKEMDEFGEWLEEFKEEKKLLYPTPMTVRPINMERAMNVFGAMNNRSVVMTVIDTNKYGQNTFKTPTMYDLFWNKYDQWLKRQEQRAWGEKKRLEGYAELADMVGVEADPGLYTEEI
jgi:hypothetical protein